MVESQKVEKIHIYSYSKVWTLEHSIYSIGNVNLPVPIHPYNMLYFAGAMLFVTLLCRAIPAFSLLPVVIRYLAIPYGLTVFLRKKKLDGKNPIKYFIAYVKYQLLENGRYFERFRSYPDRVVSESFGWICSVRYHKH